ncbi:DUF2961 domain-containing protein [Saccharopolyspora sp. HNM0983]|uniref:DUF2961 domain-containing protein n=2 Tax=Saccharopolyspora montiporae TaxID=2781240 RepID=A0A929BDR8_9PSEU|nr:DUF2961 domain-containing protein [Saccharopolyspora sp. HNM0983]
MSWSTRKARRFGACLGVASLAVAGLVGDPGAGNRAQAQPEQPAENKGPIGWDAYRQVNALAEIPGPEQSRQFSSFDRAGGNDDGFHGTYSCLDQSDRGCVIAEHAGAGEISDMWFTREPLGDLTETGNIVVELDGRVVLDAPLADVVNGRAGAPFEWPLVGNDRDTAGAGVIKVPMPYREHMRVTVQNNPDFYRVGYRAFPDAEGVQTFDPGDPATDVLDRVRRFGVADPKGQAQRTERQDDSDVVVPPGASRTLAELDGPASIDELRMQLPQLVGSPQVTDDGRAYGEGGGSDFTMRVDPNNDGVRLIRRVDPQVADQVADVFVDGQPVGRWNSGPERPGEWGVEIIEVPPELTAGKSQLEIGNRFVSSSVDVNEFRYDVHSNVGGDWTRTDVLDIGPGHPGEEAAHGYRIDNQVFERDKWVARYPVPEEEVAASEQIMENTRLRITFDGQTTVDSPIGEFFGSGLGTHDVRTMMNSVDPGLDGWLTSWWPMPFGQNARVELVNTGTVPITGGKAQVSSGPAEVGENTGYFHATHHRGQTTPGEDWTFLEAEGSGVFRGVSHSMRGQTPPDAPLPQVIEPSSGNNNRAEDRERNYLEGDERFYVDGSASPAWHGTGTEDLYEAGWYFRFGMQPAMPLAGSPAHKIAADGCEFDCTGAYRLLLNDAVPFSDGIHAGVEHGRVNDEPGDYGSTAYWYGGKPAQLRVTDEVDVGDEASRDDHGYRAEGESSAPLESTFEGDRRPPEQRESTTATGPVTFRAAVDADNDGMRVRRLGDQEQAYQAVDVRIDGQPAGRWSQPLGNPFHRWLEDDFDVPAELTRGKSEVQVELVPVADAPPWAAAHYRVFSH